MLMFTGCRSSSVNMEARSVGGWGTSRHCVVTRLEDITADQFHEICTKAGALLVMLPRHISRLLEDEKQVTSYREGEKGEKERERVCTMCTGL
jgi:hypothetical protein